MSTMAPSKPPATRSAVDRTLRLLRSLGLLGFLGGLTALASMWLLGPAPKDLGQWNLLIGLVRAVFFGCMFSGIVVLLIVGPIQWWRRRRQLAQARWFRLMLALLAVAIPTFHLWARSLMLKLCAAVDAGQLEVAAQRWDALGRAYAIAAVALLMIAALGFARPRLGQPE